MTGTPDVNILRSLGFGIIPEWDPDVAAAHVVDGWERIRKENPRLAREYRQLAWEMRQELRENLPGVEPHVVEQVALTVMGKVVAFALSLGVDPKLLGTAATVGAIAVTDGAWPASAGGTA